MMYPKNSAGYCATLHYRNPHMAMHNAATFSIDGKSVRLCGAIAWSAGMLFSSWNMQMLLVWTCLGESTWRGGVSVMAKPVDACDCPL